MGGEAGIKSWWWEPDVCLDERMRRVIRQEMLRFSKYLQAECAEENMDIIERE